MPSKKPFELRKDLKSFTSATSTNRKLARKSNFGILSEVFSSDFNLKGNNRYMKINQPVKIQLKTSGGTRSLSRFKNPILNRFDFDGEEDYQPKQFYFDFVENKQRAQMERQQQQQASSRQKSRSPSDQKLVPAIFKRTEKLVPRLSRKNTQKTPIRSQTTRVPSKPIKSNSRERIFNAPQMRFSNKSSKLAKQNSSIERGSRLKNLSRSNITINNNAEKQEKLKEIKLDSDKRKEENEKINDNKIERVIELIEKKLGSLTPVDSAPLNETNIKKIDQVSEEEKLEYFREKNIQINKSIVSDTANSNRETETLTQKPMKSKVVARDAYATENSIKRREVKSASTQTNRDLKLDLISDRLQYTETSNSYLNTLIDDVQKIFDNDEKQKGKNYQTDLSKSHKTNDLDAKDETRFTNSLGLAMEGKHGINMAIIKDVVAPEQDLDDSINKLANKTNLDMQEQVLLKKNYQNLDELISKTMLADENDSHYLMIAKLNRLKVLMEMSMKMVGRSYHDIGSEERSNLELQANRFHTTFPLPGEENLIEETNENGDKKLRMPIKIVQSEGSPKIDINNFYQIDPSEFLTMYAKRLFNHAHESTGLQFENVTVAIPAAYGTQQREAIKSSLNKASNRDDVQILTRSVAASVILNNKRNTELNRLNTDLSTSSTHENYKLVFDMTESSMDASVIRIKDSKDFHAISNVGDTSFGIHDVDERILAFIINEKSIRSRHLKKKRISLLESGSAYDLETVNAYANLIKNIKQNIIENGAVTVDLSWIDEARNPDELEHKVANPQDELFIDKMIIYERLCKDIYDWALAHIEKAITQADVNDRDVDEIIMIGEKYKMPGFFEYLRHAYPYKRISYVKEEDLAVGASIVGRKLKYRQIKITEVLCRSIGIGLYTGVITYLLFRNASLPVVGGCVYSTLVDDQESMVLDVYEGERPHIKFSRYLGEVTVYDLPKGRAGTVKCEVYLKMNHEGLLQVKALDLGTGQELRTSLDANPEHVKENDVNNDTDLDPIEAERFKKLDYDLVYSLEKLDEHLEELNAKYRSHSYSKYVLDKIFDTKEWVFKKRRTITVEECESIQLAIHRFLDNIESLA